MTAKLGENMQREWDEDPLGSELWDALQALEHDRDDGLALLTNLAVKGSPLAMMYLGHHYVSGGDPDQSALGEEWLTKSAEAGSVEGRFQLAMHYHEREAWEKALVELKALTGQGYSPATYYLGRALYRGELGYRSVPEAVAYLKMAKDAGHLPAMGLLSQIYRKEKYGLGGRIMSHWLCLTKIPALVRCVWAYPNSDRLRPYRAFSDAS